MGLVCVSVLATGLVSKLSPKAYEAKVSILPARDEVMGGGMSLGGGKEKGGGGGGGGAMVMEAMGGKTSGPSPMDVLNAILASRVLAEAVVEELNLTSYYETESTRSAVNALRGEVSSKATPYKSIEITVESKDPAMAAEIANAYAAKLDRLNKEMTLTATKRGRLFVEARLAEKTKKLAEAEQLLQDFQTKHRTLTVTDQAEAAMGTVVDLHTQIVSLEVELAALKEYATPSHPRINQLHAQIAELRRQLDRLEQEQALGIGAKQKDKLSLSRRAFPAFDDAPSLAMDFLRLSRQIKVEEAVYGMLVGMLEQAKIAEARDLPTIQVLDKALPPEYRSKPKTLQHVQVAAALSLVLGILLALFINYLEMLKAQEVAIMRRLDDMDHGAPVESDANGNGKAKEGCPVPEVEAEPHRN